MRRRSLAAVVGMLALLLAGCTGLPMAGSVQPGPPSGGDAAAPALDFRPDGPQQDATPEQIVAGFITAASSPERSWEIAASFFAPSAADNWNPEAGVIVDEFADRQYTVADDGTVTLQVTPIATVDQAGAYAPEDGDPTPLTYRLAQQDDGQWRLLEAPPGLLMDEDLFSSVFHAYSVMYFDPTWTYLVPDVRWFPTLNAASRVANALVNGEPSPWLAASVATAFPENVELTPAVPLSNGVAEAELSAQALAVDDVTLNRMQTQLQASLFTTGVTGVEMLVDGTPLDAQRVVTGSTGVDSRALVLTDAGFGFLASGQLTEIPGLSSAIEELAPVAIETAPDLGAAAVLLPNGTAARVLADGTSAVLDTRSELTAPTIDPFGAVWTVSASSPGDVQVATADGKITVLSGAWTGASRITAMQVSRDGTRMVALLTIGGRSVVAVAGVLRDARGVPTGLGQPEMLLTLPQSAADVAWLDDDAVGVLTAGADPTYRELPVGGAATELAAPVGAAVVAGANNTGSVRLKAADGGLFVRRSSTWVQSGTAVKVLAVQQGSPG